MRRRIYISTHSLTRRLTYTDTDGKKIYTNDCLVETHEFVESKGRSNQPENIGAVPPSAPASDTFVEPAYDPDLPFS